MSDRRDALKDYVEVNVRVEKFWQKYPAGRIATEIVSWENGVIVMKASAYKDLNDAVPSATGFAYEKEGSSYINKTSALENCETSAVGRALAILGFEIKKSIASKEEVENAKHQQAEMEKTDIPPVSLKAKYQMGKGSMDGFEEWVAEQQSKGRNFKDMERMLTEALMKKKEESKNAQ